MTTNDRSANLSPQQQRAVTLLIATGDPSATAKTVGVSEVTLRRWRRAPAFTEALRDAGRRSAAEASNMLLGAQVVAVSALREVLATGSPALRVRAARAILDVGIKFRENDLEDRLRALEKEVCNGEPVPSPS
jgi:transposase-like protein